MSTLCCTTQMTCVLLCCLFFLYCGDHPDLHSFPTRRSSDLGPGPQGRRAAVGVGVPEPRAGPRRNPAGRGRPGTGRRVQDRKSTRLNSSHTVSSYAVFCLKKKKILHPKQKKLDHVVNDTMQV